MLRSILLFAALSATLLGAAESKSSESALHLLTYSGDQSALDAVDRELAAAGTDASKLAALEKQLLDVLRRNDATFAARQAVCQRLGLILAQSAPELSPEIAKRLGAMLADDRDADIARLALERVPGKPVDALLITALGKTTGRTRLGLIDSLGRRRAGSAVAALTVLLADADAGVATATAKALGVIGDSAAVTALRSAPASIAPAAAAAKIVAAQRLPAEEALAVCREVESDTRAPAATRAAAFRTSLTFDPAAPQRIAEALGGADASLKPVAIEAIGDLSGGEIIRALTAALHSWDPQTQAGVVSALGRRGDEAAVPAVTAAVAHSDPDVRMAAIAALGALPGSRDTVQLLAKTITGADASEAKLARQSLARLNGRDVSAAIISGAERGDAAVRVVYLEQLALRNMTEGLPLLWKCRTDPDSAVRIAAAGALGEIAPLSELPQLAKWTIEAKDESEQSRALRSLVNVALRDRNAATRGRPVCEIIESAQPAVAVRLLPALSRIGGEQSAACAGRLALRDDPKLSEAAIATLARWTDQTALRSLATVATKAAAADSRSAAVDAAIATFERNRGAWNEKSSEVVATLFAATPDTPKRKALLALLTYAKDGAALKLVQGQQADPALGEAARYTAAVIQANRAGPPAVRASNPSNTKSIIDGKTSTRWTATTNGEEWIEVDFRATRPLRSITLDQSGRTTDFPEHYEVFVTNDPKNPGQPLTTGKGQRNKTVIELPSGTSGRYLIIRNTAEREEGQWAISELVVD